MRITSAGNVGIGTDNPARLLSLYSNNAETTPRFLIEQDGTGDAVMAFSLTGSQGWSMGIDNSLGDAFMIHNSAGGVDSSSQLTIATDGDVGIGTVSPDEKLHVSNGKVLIDVTSSVGTELIFKNLAADQFAADKNYHEINFITSATSSETTGGYVRIKAGQEVSGTDNKSYLGFWTAPDDGTVTEKMRIDSDGNVGIGTNSPDAKLEVRSDGWGTLAEMIRFSTTAGNAGYANSIVSKQSTGSGFNTILGFDLNTGTTGVQGRVLTLLGDGNVGIGTDSPRGILDLKYSGNGTLSNTTSEYQLVLEAPSGTSNYGRNIGWSESTGVNVITSAINAVDDGASSATGLTFSTGNSSTLTEKMRITSAGDFIFNTGSSSLQTYPTQGSNQVNAGGSTYFSIGHITGSSNGNLYMGFGYNGTGIGSITQNGTTGVSYNTSSDYRLKEDLKDFAGLDMVSKIPVYDFKWKTDESRSYGVMAHEIQEVLPDAVTGEKDAEDMQSVDYSKIVPLLVKSIQELTAKVEMLEKNCQCKN